MTLQSTLQSGILALLSLGALIAFPAWASGDEFVGPPLPPPIPDQKNRLDSSRDYLSDQFVDFVSYIDRFFGNDRNYQDANDSVMQVDIMRVSGYGGNRAFVWSARANVHLPIAEKKLHLLLETDPDKNATVDPRQSLSPPLAQPTSVQSYAAALRIEEIAAEEWHFNLDGGLKFAGLNTAPFARTGAVLAVPLGLWRARFSETAYWFNTTGVGETTELDLDRPISEPVSFRSTSVAVWLDRTQYFDMRQDLTVFHKLNERTALMYQVSAFALSRPNTVVTEYVVLMLYRYRLHREWMFFEVSPQLHFPRALNFHENAMLSLRLEMLFDGM